MSALFGSTYTKFFVWKRHPEKLSIHHISKHFPTGNSRLSKRSTGWFVLPQPKKTTFLCGKDQSILFSILIGINSKLGKRILMLNTIVYLAQNSKFFNKKVAPKKHYLFISIHTKYSCEIFLEIYVTVSFKQSGNRVQFNIPGK